jgi:hypothetical protein
MPIAHRTARRIASQWYDSQGSALYALSSSGALDPHRTHDIEGEINHCISHEQCPHERFELTRLRDYVNHHKPRGPVPAWSKMPW